MKFRFLIIGVIVVFILAMIAVFSQKISDRYYCTHQSISRAHNLAEACVIYRQDPHSEGKYPANLSDLIQPPFVDRKMLVSDPKIDFIDGWGTPLRYAVVLNERGDQEAYVWAERIVDGKTYLCGAKATADGQTVRFGLPE